MIRKVYHTLRVVMILTRFAYRFFTGRPLSGERKTDATFFRPATRSLDPSGTALRWEMMRGAARLAYRLAGLYVAALSVALLALWGAGKLLELPGYLRPGNILLTHLLFSVSIGAAYLLRKRIVEYGVRLPYPVRVEKMWHRQELESGEIPEEEIAQAETGAKHWEIRWYVREGRKEWEKEKVLPLAHALAPMLNTHVTPARARKMLHIPRDYRKEGSSIEVLLPLSFTGADAGTQRRIVSTIRAKLGLREELEERWELEGSAPRLLVSMPAAPPSFISFQEVLHFLEAAEEFNPFVGVVGGGSGMNVSLKADSPHIAVSAGSGAGKSILIMWLAMQFRRWGWNVIILDWKEESHEWAKGLDGVRYCTSIQQIHDMCIALGDEVEARKANPHVERPKTLIISEEWNITAPLLADYWSELRALAEPEERRVMPLRSPALTGLMKVNFTGRQLMMCQLLVAQRFSARVTNGNADLRESFQVLFMARWKSQTLKMLAGGIKPFPKKPKDVGRWVAVVGDEAFTVQIPFATNEEARAFALSGEPAAMSPWIERGLPSSPHREEMGNEQTFPLGDRLAPPHQIEGTEAPPVQLMKLSDMVERLIHLGITHNILKHAAKDPSNGGDPSFPIALGGSPNRGYTYDFNAVKEWAERRVAARAAERQARA